MNRSRKIWFLSVLVMVSAFALGARSGLAASIKTWTISGKVLSLQGEPLANVRVKFVTDSNVKGRKVMVTNSNGEFQSDIGLKFSGNARLQGSLVASKAGYAEAHEMLDLYFDSSAGDIEIILCRRDEGADQLPMAALVGVLGPQLKAGAAKAFPEEAAQKEFVSGYEELIDRGNAGNAIALFRQSVERTPDCMECQMLLGLALLHAGQWGSALRQLEDISILSELLDAQNTELKLIQGVVEAWRGRRDAAIALFRNVLAREPQNALTLQELGRIAAAQKQWEIAEQLLSKSLQIVKSEEASLLQVRMYLELGMLEDASEEMARYAAGRNVKDLPPAARALHEKVKNQISLLPKGQLKTMTTLSVEELLETLPELRGLAAAADQSLLEGILEKTGAGVDAFFSSIPNTASREKVHQERLKRNGKVDKAMDQEFMYVMLAQSGEPGLGIREYRSTDDGQEAIRGGLKQGYMLTSGFASSVSIFHPVNRNGADFRYLGTQAVDGRTVHILAFSQKPTTAKMVTRFVMPNRSALVLVHGLAWVDAQSFRILRLQTFLLNPLPAVRLSKLSTRIQYHEVVFEGLAKPLWLPQEVEISVHWRDRYLHNRHTYSEFGIFSVEAKEVRKPIAIPAPPPENTSETEDKPGPRTSSVQ